MRKNSQKLHEEHIKTLQNEWLEEKNTLTAQLLDAKEKVRYFGVT